MDAFIDDGYTEAVGIEALDGVHPGMEFTYRPFAGEEASEAFRLIAFGPTYLKASARKLTPQQAKKREKDIADEQKPEATKQRLFDLLADRVPSWGFAGRKIDYENLNRMNAKLFARFKGVVLGDEAPDYRLDADGNRIEATETDAESDAKN